MHYKDDDGAPTSAAFVKSPSSGQLCRVLHEECDGFLLQRQASLTVAPEDEDEDDARGSSLPPCHGKYGDKHPLALVFEDSEFVGDSHAGDSVLTLWRVSKSG